MTPEEFVACIRDEILEKYLQMLHQELADGVIHKTRSFHWPDAVDFYRSLDAQQRVRLMTVSRQIIVDTLSYVFGILDGSTLLEHHREYFRLTYGNDSDKLNGDLQDLFLSGEP